MKEDAENLLNVIDKDTNAADRKRKGFLREMKRLGYEDPEKDVYHTSYGLEGGAQIAEVLREKGYDGVVFGEDLTAVGALNQWEKRRGENPGRDFPDRMQ